MFNFAIEDGLLESSPCSMIKRPSKETARDRALSNDEIRVLWSNIDKRDIIMTANIKKAIKLILVTGQRPGEVIGMHSKEIKDRWWTIPRERTKTDRAHRVYLTDLALDLIGNIKGRGYIFPSPLNTDNLTEKKKKNKAQVNTADEKKIDTHIGEKALTCALRRNIKGQAYRHKIKQKALKALPENPNRLGVEHFTPHDLRRTATTLMAQCGVIHEHRERVASHSMGKMDKTYNQHDFDIEKQKALETLSKKISEIIAPPKRPHYRINPDRTREVIIYPDDVENT